jgi:hypothetical protein
MGRFIVRCSIVFAALYMSISLIVAQFFGVDILTTYYYLLFELCAVIYCFSEGKYHCKYIKYTALALLLSDLLTQLDCTFDFLSVEAHNYIPIALIFTGITAGVSLAISHFIKVSKLKTRRNGRNIKN